MKIIFFLACLFYSFSCSAQMTANQCIRMEITEAQFTFNNATVSKASIVVQNGRFTGLHITLKPAVVKVFIGMIKSHIGKSMNLVFNQKIVSSSILNSELGSELLISGITREDAELFIQLLRINDSH